MVQESGTHEIAHEPLVLAEDLRLDLERLAENVAHAAEPSAQHVTIELQRIAWETVRRAFRAAEDAAAAPRPRAAVSTIDLARHLMHTATTVELRAWWRREVLFLESVERVVTEPQRRRSPPP
ncbi:hypothetical protein BH11MYX4_BH11MYX4_23100 [soil metagenome]